MPDPVVVKLPGSAAGHSNPPPQAELAHLLALQRSALSAAGESPGYTERRALLQRLLDLLMANRLALADAMSGDFGGRPRAESLLELFVVIDDLRHALGRLKRWMKPRGVMANWQFLPSRAQLRPQPLGVVGVIGAFNYPVMTLLSPVVGALAAGNRVMMKPSDLTPKTATLLRTLFGRHFAPEQAVVVTGGVEVAEAFSALPFDHLVFTGSTRVGRIVAQAAARNLVPVTLELGGKCPAIVGRDFDLKEAAWTIVQAKFLNAGQTCVTSDYALVHGSQREAFLAHCRDAIRAFYPKLVDNRDYGRLAQPSAWQRLEAWVSEARAGGATVEVVNPANEACTGDNRVFPPTLVSGVAADARLAREEIFGPVLPVQTYDSIDDAIAQVNAGERPLALYVFSRDDRVVERVVNRTISGGVNVNGIGYQAIQHRLPFGGVGASGMGAYRGQAAFDRFSHVKPVLFMSRMTRANVFLRPPYQALAAWVLGFMLHNRPRKEDL